MPFRYFKVSIQGSMPAGEVWSVNPTFTWTGLGPDTTPSSSTMQSIAIAVRNVVPPTSITQIWSSAVAQTGVRVEARNYSGPLEALGQATLTTPRTGSGTATKPYQTCMVASLRTAFPGGRYRGRLYWPALNTGLTATLRFNETQALGVATGTWTWLNAIADAINSVWEGEDVYPAVISSTASNGAAIQYVQCGDVPDVQRRRRDRAVETYYRYPAED